MRTLQTRFGALPTTAYSSHSRASQWTRTRSESEEDIPSTELNVLFGQSSRKGFKVIRRPTGWPAEHLRMSFRTRQLQAPNFAIAQVVDQRRLANPGLGTSVTTFFAVMLHTDVLGGGHSSFRRPMSHRPSPQVGRHYNIPYSTGTFRMIQRV